MLHENELRRSGHTYCKDQSVGTIYFILFRSLFCFSNKFSFESSSRPRVKGSTYLPDMTSNGVD